MLFNSLEFAFYLPLIFLAYWLLKEQLKAQNTFLVVASYIFYGWWDWHFLTLIIFSSIVDYLIGLFLRKEEKKTKRKLLLGVSLLTNLGLLGVFKYYNFFVESFVDAFSLFGHKFDIQTLSVVIPVGISFYTFQTLSYSIDVYRKKLEPARDLISFFAFVSFFPQLVAGPIERATNLLPQFYKPRRFEYHLAADGMRQILWGLFKKIVIADNCAPLVNEVFTNYTDLSGGILLLGAILFSFQIYCDFSGYSDIAIGTARLFGFKLMQNFAFPYFSRDIGEFWRRWHISLSTWFRDYLYIPLGGSRGGQLMKIRNTFAIFLVSGFWHGANWTYVIWGFINACYFLPLLLLKQNRKNLDTVAADRYLPSLREFGQILFTFFITTLAWIFFRSASIQQALLYIERIFIDLFFGRFFETLIPYLKDSVGLYLLLMIFILLITEWIQRNQQHGLELVIEKTSGAFRWMLYLGIYFIIVLFGSFSESEFIYFQF